MEKENKYHLFNARLIFMFLTIIFCFSESYKIKEMSTEPVSLEDEFKKNPNLPISDIKELQEWIKTQPYLPQDITGK